MVPGTANLTLRPIAGCCKNSKFNDTTAGISYNESTHSPSPANNKRLSDYCAYNFILRVKILTSLLRTWNFHFGSSLVRFRIRHCYSLFEFCYAHN